MIDGKHSIPVTDEMQTLVNITITDLKIYDNKVTASRMKTEYLNSTL